MDGQPPEACRGAKPVDFRALHPVARIIMALFSGWICILKIGFFLRSAVENCKKC
jgi:hypothetical protein